MSQCPTCQCDMLDEYAGSCPFCNPKPQTVFMVGGSINGYSADIVGLFATRQEADAQCLTDFMYYAELPIGQCVAMCYGIPDGAVFPRQGQTE